MKFHIPAAKDEQSAEEIYGSIKEFVGSGAAAEFSARRVKSLSWYHNGKSQYAEVGKAAEFNGEIVIAILYDESRHLYHVCTPNRGVLRGESIMAGEDWRTTAHDFDA